MDSGVVKGGKFVLTGKVDVPVRYQLGWIYHRIRIWNTRKICVVRIFSWIHGYTLRDAFYRFFSFSDDFHRKEVKGKVLITGSPVHDLYLKYKEKIRPYSNRSSEAWNEYLKVYHIPALDGVFNTREGLAWPGRCRRLKKR